ncbi:hypothetical protein C8R46DRAFT_1215782 [Mycena filopes]|nr:hypothetical protein C8R46DRAFT_1215782 [Mycena filopes]
MSTPGKAVKTASSKSSFLDKAVRYLLDSDTTPDHCSDEIWLLGEHPGWAGESGDADTQGQDLSHQWPSQFFDDFRSRVWCTYRKDFEPIRDGARGWSSGAFNLRNRTTLTKTLALTRRWMGLYGADRPAPSSITTTPAFSPTTTSNSTSSSSQEDHTRSRTRQAAYVRLLTWFFDSPAPPFSVHRMVLAGKDAGTQVGQWFGPSVAAGAIKTLVQAFPACGMGVSVAADGVLYQSTVFEASHTSPPSESDSETGGSLSWGDRPVLLLLGLRLGLDGVNPIYHDTLKQLYTFTQSVGIAGGRPSSSYYSSERKQRDFSTLTPIIHGHAVPIRSSSQATTEKDMDDAAEQYYASAYTAAELQTFHCDKVRKMPLHGLDPSMLVGFLCRNAEEWTDFRKRVVELPRAVFSVQEEPPSWPSVDLGGDEEDDALALESLASSEDPPPASPAPVGI